VRISMKFLVPALAASVLLSACGSSSNSSSSASGAASTSSNGGSAALVKTASNSTLGRTILVNSQGLTLYHLSAEQGGKFICTSTTCLQAWHPLTLAAGSKPSGTIGSLSVVKRPDGTEQVTYKRMPLYTFVHDTAPGQANGQGIKDVGTWTAITTSASSAPAPSTTSTSTTKSYGY
jgi:predicted lipoprotein with Yx(FWY)xxD motif